MLLGLHPLLHPDLLHALASMGHGDTVAIVDANFPAASTARGLAVPVPLILSVDAVTAVEAVLSVLPVDTFDPERPAVTGMAIVDRPDAVPAVVRDAAPLFAARGETVALLERFAFYDAAGAAHAVILTTESRPYGNFIIRKGVVTTQAWDDPAGSGEP